MRHSSVSASTSITIVVPDPISITIVAPHPPKNAAKLIALELPRITKKGIVMPNYELMNDTVATITIKTTDAAGDVEAAPSGDVFSAVSSAPSSLGAVIGVDGSGNPALVLTPLVRVSPNIKITVSDSAGLAQAEQLVDIVEDITPRNVVLDLAEAALQTQAVPTATGP